MTFQAQVFRVLIASPLDVESERELAVRAIQAWNDQFSSERRVVLLPLRWETHSFPEFGRPPQETINQQVVDHCDLLVGIFWTRIGSPTAVADSGTIEEIERVATAGKTVMLYFSQNKQDPEKIDLEQLAKLREFKKKTLPNSLVANFNDPQEFSDKFAKHLDAQVRNLLSEQGSTSLSQGLPMTDIVLSFTNEDGEFLGDEITLETALINVDDLTAIPDYDGDQIDENPKAAAIKTGVIASAFGGNNKDYYRQYANYFILRSFFRKISFQLKNQGGIGARDIYIDLEINVQDEGKGAVFVGGNQIPASPPPLFSGKNALLSATYTYPELDNFLSNEAGGWNIPIELPALQPQRVVQIGEKYWLGAKEDCTVIFTARIYADTLSEPITKHLKVHFIVKELKAHATELTQVVDSRLSQKNSTLSSQSEGDN